jgi:hypothetical protein
MQKKLFRHCFLCIGWHWLEMGIPAQTKKG